MKKRKVFFRLVLLLFLITAPLYLLRIAYFNCKIIMSKRALRREVLTNEIRKNSLVRKENFLEDKNYKIALEKLKKEKAEAKGVVIVDQ